MSSIAFWMYVSWVLLNLRCLSTYAMNVNFGRVLLQRLQMNLFSSMGLTASRCAPCHQIFSGAEPEAFAELDEGGACYCAWVSLRWWLPRFCMFSMSGSVDSCATMRAATSELPVFLELAICCSCVRLP